MKFLLIGLTLMWLLVCGGIAGFGGVVFGLAVGFILYGLGVVIRKWWCKQ
ncbi:TPA: hypothetical protein ACPZ0W_001339 [Enterobacter bugandensis]|nr:MULTISPECIES: hypothetical protein [Enterobacter]MCK1123332.1 hypothetical protein [Enterobacter bugandensis]MCK6849434.1 hypothetical protein [Enterobacter bugandensis]MCM7682661.1 hypothetical protein [Enterobacter bugandensis]MCM7766860.1 hypothetical protein [Enterobacter bugandensis]HBM7583635.1 hypothetical protein [Enterobacter bugandensis]